VFAISTTRRYKNSSATYANSDSESHDYPTNFGNDSKRETLIQAIRYCGYYKLVMPEWVAEAFNQATGAWQRGEYKNVSEAFGVQDERQGVHLKALQKRMKLRIDILLRIDELHRGGDAISVGLFEKVAKEFGRNKKLITKIYYEGKREIFHDMPYEYMPPHSPGEDLDGEVIIPASTVKHLLAICWYGVALDKRRLGVKD